MFMKYHNYIVKYTKMGQYLRNKTIPIRLAQIWRPQWLTQTNSFGKSP